jgi:putative membrane protein
LLVSRSDLPVKRLHPLAALLSTGRTLRGLLPLVIISLVSDTVRGSGVIYYVALFSLLASIAEGIGSWLRFRYWVEAGELRVERGFLVKRRIFIPGERIQAVDVSAGLLARMLGLVRVELKTAAAGTQAELSAISLSDAEALKLALLVRSDAEAPAPFEVEEPSAQASHEPAMARYTLRPRDLLLAASTSGRFGVLLSFMVWLFAQVDELLEDQLLRLLDALTVNAAVTRSNPWLVATVVVGILLVSFVVSVAAEVVKFGGFSVERRGDRLVIARGLFERREVSVRVERIQAIRIVEGVLRQPLGYGSIVVESAGHADERGQSTELHPFLHRSEWQRFLIEMAPEHSIEPVLVRPPRRALVRFLLRPTLFALACLLAIWFYAPFLLPLAPLSFVAPWLGWLAYRDAAIGTEGDTMLLRRRALRRTTFVVQRRRVQHATVSATILQRRRALASFTIAAASGASGRAFSTPHIDARVALNLLTWCGARRKRMQSYP